jgi:hypothetical protein
VQFRGQGDALIRKAHKRGLPKRNEKMVVGWWSGWFLAAIGEAINGG